MAPVIDNIASSFGVTSGTAGILTALPGFLFALMGWGAVPMARRFGFTSVLTVGATLITLGLCVRPFVGAFPVFLLLTTAVVAGIAVGNVLLPPWIKEHVTPRQAVPLMSAYSAILGLSGAIAPLSALFVDGEQGWRWAVGVWAFPAVIQLLIWVFLLFRTGVDTPEVGESTTTEHTPAQKQSEKDASSADEAAERARKRRAARAPLWRSHTAVAMLLFFGTQSSMAYTSMGWLPHMLTDNGVSDNVASISLVIFGVFNVIGGLVMPPICARLHSLTFLPVALAVITCAGWLGVLLAPGAAPLTWGTLLGIGGMCFPLAIALLTQRTKSPLVTARLSGFVQPGGYVIAGVVPLVVGWLYDLHGSWNLSLWFLMALSAGLLVFGVRATRDVFIDDELARS